MQIWIKAHAVLQGNQLITYFIGITLFTPC
jgi:hypothetical protein